MVFVIVIVIVIVRPVIAGLAVSAGEEVRQRCYWSSMAVTWFKTEISERAECAASDEVCYATPSTAHCDRAVGLSVRRQVGMPCRSLAARSCQQPPSGRNGNVQGPSRHYVTLLCAFQAPPLRHISSHVGLHPLEITSTRCQPLPFTNAVMV